MKKRLLAVLSAISILLSGLTCMQLFASAEQSYGLETNIVTNEWLGKNFNILSDTNVKIVSTIANQSKDFGKISSLSDNDIGTSNDIWATECDAPQTTSYIFSLGVIQSVSKFAVVGKGNETYTPQEFGIYASESEESLFNDENLVIDYKNGTTGALSYLLTAEEPVSARYIGFRFTKPNKNSLNSDNKDYTLCLGELGVYSDADAIVIEENTVDDEWLAANDNILNGKTVTVLDHNAQNPSESSPEELKNLTDGTRENNYAIWTKYESFDKVDITADLSGEYNISRIAFAGQSAFVYSPRRFQIFLSDSKEELYNGKPVIDFENAAPDKTSSWVFNLAVPVSANYISLRILTPGYSGYNEFLIEELGAYDYYTVDSETTLSDGKDYFIPEGSVFDGSEPVAKNEDGTFDVAGGYTYRKFAKPAAGGVTTFGVSYKGVTTGGSDTENMQGIQFGSYTEDNAGKEFYTLIIRGKDKTAVNALSDELKADMAKVYLNWIAGKEDKDKWGIYTDELSGSKYEIKVVKQSSYIWKNSVGTKLQYAVRLYGDFSSSELGNKSFSAIGFSRSGNTISFADSFKTASYNELAE